PGLLSVQRSAEAVGRLKAAWARWSLAEAIRLAGHVAAVGRFPVILWRHRASAEDPATERRKGGMGVGGVGVGSMVIITGLAAGQATAGAAASDGRSGNAGNGAAMAGPGGRRQARVRRVRPVGWRVAPAGEGSSGCAAVGGARHAIGRNSGPCGSRPAGRAGGSAG